jgi:phenylalanyl-tRNA synthetase beta chain
VDFFDMKGIAERICQVVRADVRAEQHREPWLVPGRTAAVMSDGTRVGVVGQLTSAVLERHGLGPGDVVYAVEIDLDALDRFAAGHMRVEPLPRYPSAVRDIAVLVDDTTPAAAIRATIHDAAPPTLVRVREFDRYQGKGIPENKVSLALRLTFRSSDRTLTDAEVQDAMNAIVAALKERHGAVQR